METNGPVTIKAIAQAVADLRAMTGQMIKIRTVRGVRLKDGRELVVRKDEQYVLYDNGVQQEDDGGATLYSWSDISEVLV
jgi:hypothetical protein